MFVFGWPSLQGNQAPFTFPYNGLPLGFAEFRRSSKSIFDKARPGGPKAAMTAETVVKFHDLVLANCREKVGEMAEMLAAF